MEENIELKNISNEDLIVMYKIVIDFVNELEKQVEKSSQEEVS